MLDRSIALAKTLGTNRVPCFDFWRLNDQAPYRNAMNQELLRDRDTIYGGDFREQVRDMGIEDVLSTPRSPSQRAYAERVIASIRRECLDHVIVFDEGSLRRILASYLDYATGPEHTY